MYELEAVFHAVFVNILKGCEEFSGCESKFACIASAFFPSSGARGCEFDAYAHVGAYAYLLCYAGDYLQFVEFLHDDEYASSHLLCEEGEFDVVLVFVPVAYDE